ncbi:MAG: MFS transporter [Candidatus Dormibacteraeota bacterium]|nr:MFS transporter [Candidatus Dormibacteraeota bacterium]
MNSLRHRDPASVYLLMRGASNLFFALISIVNLVYQFEVAHLDPLGLLLVGSTLELTCLVFQVPTGLLADTYSRKPAIVAGTVLVGAGFLLEGLVPNFWAILVAQVIWGAGVSLADGADDAWITDEVGVERASGLFLRASQAGQVGGLLGIVAGVALATVRLNLPIVAGGLLTLLLGVGLHFLIREDGFVPAPRHLAGGLATMAAKARESLGVIRANRILLSILLITAIAGASSEGVDRLFQVHLLKDVGLPHLPAVSPLYWFAFLTVGSIVIGLGVTEWARRSLDLEQHRVAVRALFLATTILAAAIVAFALVPSFPAAVVAYWVMRNADRVWQAVQRAWLNQSLDPATRATLFSLDGQANALGQIVSGPGLGLLARSSIPAAIALAGVLLLPALAVYARESRRIFEMPVTVD